MFGHGFDFIRIFLKIRLQVRLKKYLALWLQLKQEERRGITAVFLWVCAVNWRLLWLQAWRGHNKHAPDLPTSNTTFQLGPQPQNINHVTALWPATQIWPHKSQQSWRDERLTFDLYRGVGSNVWMMWRWGLSAHSIFPSSLKLIYIISVILILTILFAPLSAFFHFLYFSTS